MRRERGDPQPDEKRPHQKGHVHIGRYGGHPHAQQHGKKHGDRQRDELERNRSTAAEIERQQNLQHVNGDKFRKPGEIQANVNDCDRKEHQVERRNRNPGFRQCIQNLAGPRAEFLVQKQ